jgi:two-component system cell cycle response regulator
VLPKIDISGLRLTDAKTLLRQSGHPVPESDALPEVQYLQAIIDGLCEISSRDPLTALANLRHFHAALEQELNRVARSGSPMSLLLIDGDHFKAVNDTYGHPAGDRVLQAIAHHLQANMRPMDTPARYGGEEFTAILPNCLPAHAWRAAERIRSQIAQTPVTLADGRSLCVTVSIGVACIGPWQQANAAELVASADRQLYLAKNGGRNRIAMDAAAESAVTDTERSALFLDEMQAPYE